jgi:hypothetical protein
MSDAKAMQGIDKSVRDWEQNPAIPNGIRSAATHPRYPFKSHSAGGIAGSDQLSLF